MTATPADKAGEASLPAVDVIIPLRNEAHNIARLERILASQTLTPQRVIVADGMSTDGSRDLLADLSQRLPSLTVVDNPARLVPHALNVALAEVTSPVTARMDLHADYAPDYLHDLVGVLADRPEISGVGGGMATAGRGATGRAIASTLNRSFGLGGARHRVGGEAGPIPHVFSGCYRTQALRDIGGWDERLLANEDFEADIRIGEAGGMIWLVPHAETTWYVREDFRALAVQMWRYGYYKSLTLRLHPSSLSPRQLAPPLLVLALAGLSLTSPRRAAAVGAAYAGAAGALGARAARADGASALRGALAPPVVHLAWGTGLISGVPKALRLSSAERQPEPAH